MYSELLSGTHIILQGENIFNQPNSGLSGALWNSLLAVYNPSAARQKKMARSEILTHDFLQKTLPNGPNGKGLVFIFLVSRTYYDVWNMNGHFKFGNQILCFSKKMALKSYKHLTISCHLPSLKITVRT